MTQSVVIPLGDFVSPGMRILWPDAFFPNLRAVDPRAVADPWLCREIPHRCYVDQRAPALCLLSRDESHLLYNTALQFQGMPALQLGSGLGWSAFHMAKAGIHLEVWDRYLAQANYYAAVAGPLATGGLLSQVNLRTMAKPEEIHQTALREGREWAFIFLDPDRDLVSFPRIVEVCAAHAAADALMIFNHLVVPEVAQAWKSLQNRGWQIGYYQTRQILGVAWRGQTRPVEHLSDPAILWPVPAHLEGLPILGWHNGVYGNQVVQEFLPLVREVEPFTLLTPPRLISLFTLVRHICLADLPGNIVECGTARGGAAVLMARVVKLFSKRPRKVFCCDTFEGMPDPTEVDKHRGIPANDTGWGAGAIVAPVAQYLDQIAGRLDVRDIIVPIKGLFADTLPKHKGEIGTIALLHADSDWYQSTMDVFNHLYDQVLPGGLIQIDDYGHWEGCKMAIHDFERQRGTGFFLNPLDYAGMWLRKQ